MQNTDDVTLCGAPAIEPDAAWLAAWEAWSVWRKLVFVMAAFWFM